MEKLMMATKNATLSNIALIGQRFPHVLTEKLDKSGEVRQAIDFELLHQELSDAFIEGEKEQYQLNWPGKKQALLHASSSTSSTLLPVKEGSVNWDNTSNLYIEGDNIEVLKLMQQSYSNRIKMIVVDTTQGEQERALLTEPLETKGNLHSGWLSMMYIRLKLARSLLRDDGVLFVSITDDGLGNMLKLLEELFNREHYIAHFVWQSGCVNDVKQVEDERKRMVAKSTAHQHILMFAKNSGTWRKSLHKDNDCIVRDTWWSSDKVGDHATARKQLQELFPQQIVDASKPSTLITHMMKVADVGSADIVLDLISSTATTAHAVMALNAESNGSRSYIMVQLPERTKPNSRAAQAGYRTISQIGRERILRAAHKIKSETGAAIDYGFRLFRLASSNMKDVYYSAQQLGQLDIEQFVSSIKEGRSEEDLLIQVMLELGLPLAASIEAYELEGVKIHQVAGNRLLACFAEHVPNTVMEYVAKQQPHTAVFRDSSFVDDGTRKDVVELFKTASAYTKLRVM